MTVGKVGQIMSKNLEIEFKTLITSDDFSRLVNYFELKEEHFFVQTNYYFDTPNFLLKEKQMGLRVRILSTHAEITLKIPEKIGLLEITDVISLDKAQQIISTNTLPNIGNVFNQLQSLMIDRHLFNIIGCLKTKRAEKKLPQGLLVLDESWYNQHHDFELELEVVESVLGKQNFHELLDQLNINKTITPNKIERMLASSNFETI